MPRWPNRTLEERFWEKVDKSGDCWLWTASTMSRGYGQFVISKNNHILAHIFAYQQLIGPVPEGLELDHIRCVRRCVRPDHLRPVTRKQNLENKLILSKNNKSGVRGVHWLARDKRWRARVQHNGQYVTVGYFKDLHEAEEAVITKRIELFTHNTLDREGLTCRSSSE